MAEITKIDNFKQELHSSYYKTLVNFMKNEESAKKFMSSVVYSIQKTPKLLECDRDSVMQAFMTCAEFGMYPSSASGECYVLPYGNKAQFQLGYQGLITLFYKAGIGSIRSDIIREKDDFEYVNGKIKHKIDIFKSNKERGKAVGAFAIATVNGEEIGKAMNSDDILKFKSFSKSASSSFSPWNESKDPELWMWKKTVIKQLSKMLPKNETINRAVEQDNRDSIISDEKINEMESDDIITEKLAGFSAEEGKNKKMTK